MILQGWVEDFDDRMTDKGTLVIPKSLSRLKIFEIAFNF